MRKISASMITQQVVILSILILFAGCAGGSGGGNSESTPPVESNNDPGSVVTFTYTLDPGQINNLPSEADHVKVVLDGNVSTAEVTSRIIIYADSPSAASVDADTLTLSFNVSPGEHTYTVSALKGTSELETIGPITFTKVKDIPLTAPIAFDFPSFDTNQTDVGLDIPNVSIYFGTSGKDRIVQYGGSADDALSVDSGAGNDWAEQYGESGVDTMAADTGTGSDYIYQEGGAGNDAIRATPGEGNDTVIINAGTGDDTITYDVGIGTDTASIDGGAGTDTLIMNQNWQPVLIQDDRGNVIYQTGSDGTTITVVNVEQIIVLDDEGNVVWPAP
jgi:Ca2+-binding RTX toxin-like protein